MAGAAREVIQDWADGEGGYTFERGRMESAVRSICFEKPATLKLAAPVPKSAIASAGVKPKKEDIEMIANELWIPKQEAERALSQNGGDLANALESLLSTSITS